MNSTTTIQLTEAETDMPLLTGAKVRTELGDLNLDRIVAVNSARTVVSAFDEDGHPYLVLMDGCRPLMAI